jgi:rubrerythrin
MHYAFANSAISEEALCEILTRLWQIKLRSIDLMERWYQTTTDSDIRAGLKVQLADEWRHRRLLAEELRRRTGRLPTAVDHVVTKAFALVQAQPTESLKVCAFYRGIKASTNQRYYKLLWSADVELLDILEQIIQDDDRHLRWADIRLRGLSGEEVRHCTLLLLRMSKSMQAVWLRPWRNLPPSLLSYLAS